MLAAFELPSWAHWFLLGGIGLVVIGVPVRMIWKATKKYRDDNQLLNHLALRLRETFTEVTTKRPLLGSPTVHFKYQRKSVRMTVHSKRKIHMKIEATPDVPLPVVVRSARWIKIAAVMEGWDVLDQIGTGDPLIDKEVELYANGILAGFLRDKILGETPLEGPATGLAESLIVIKSTPGVKKFVLRFSPKSGVTLDMKLRGQDLLYRSEDIESLLHHIHILHDFIINYDRPGLPPRAAEVREKKEEKKTGEKKPEEKKKDDDDSKVI